MLVAISQGEEACVRILIAAGANTTAKTDTGERAVELAMQQGNQSIITMLEEEDPEWQKALTLIKHVKSQGKGFRLPTPHNGKQAPESVKAELFSYVNLGYLDKVSEICQKWSGNKMISERLKVSRISRFNR